MSSIPQDVLAGASQRRWLRLDSPELGLLCGQGASDSSQASDKGTLGESIDQTTPTHHDQKRQHVLDVDPNNAT